MHCSSGRCSSVLEQVVGKAHKTPRRWLKPKDGIGAGRQETRPRPSPASYAVHEARNGHERAGTVSARSSTASRLSRVSRPPVWTKIKQNKTTRGGRCRYQRQCQSVSSVSRVRVGTTKRCEDPWITARRLSELSCQQAPGRSTRSRQLIACTWTCITGWGAPLRLR